MSMETNLLGSEIRKQGIEDRFSSQPVFLSSVVVNGGENVSRQLLASLLEPLIEKSDYTLSQLAQEIDRSSVNLKRVGIFGLIVPSLHVDYTRFAPKLKSFNHDEAIATKVVFDLESSELSAGEFSIAYNSEDNLTLDLGYVNTNLNHNAEFAEIGVNYRPYKPFEHLASNMRLESYLRNPAFRVVLELSNKHESNEKWSSKTNKSVACLLGISYLNQANTFSVFNGISMAQKTFQDYACGAKNKYTFSESNILKPSVITQLSYNSNPVPTILCEEGVKISLQNQFSLNDQSQQITSSGVGFMKTELSSSLSKFFFNKSVRARIFQETGAIVTNGTADEAHEVERFYMGGYDSFKGFSRNGVNEKGGRQFYKIGASVDGSVPSFLRQIADPVNSAMKLYATGMVGDVSNAILTGNGVFSVGFGLRYQKKLINLDLGYFMAQRIHDTNSNGVKDGFQLEISLGGSGRID